jgi:predicted peptidase
MFRLLPLMLCLTLTGCNRAGSVYSSTASFAPNTGFLDKTLTLNDTTHKYVIFVPKSYQPGQRHPTIIFLHGVLEAGSDGRKNVGKGLGPFIARDPDHWPFVTLFPQSSGDWQGDDRARLVLAALDDAVRSHGADPDRVILTGLSNGGQGAWIIGARHRERFAALVPMCGHTAYDAVPDLKSIPIWCFHNDLDMLVGCGGSREMCKRINEAGGNAKLTTYGGLAGDLNHNVWDRAYKEPELVPWMLKQRRRGPSGSLPEPD